MSDLFFGSGRRHHHPKNPKMFLVGSKYQVFNGNAHHTSSGLIQADLKQNKRGHIVSRRASNAGKSKNPQWIAAIKAATRELKSSGKKFTIKDIAHVAQDLYFPGPKRSTKKKRSSGPRRKISSILHRMPTKRKVSRRKSRKSHTVAPNSALPSYSATQYTVRKSRRTSRRARKQTVRYTP
jgi:hypothetical protein